MSKLLAHQLAHVHTGRVDINTRTITRQAVLDAVKVISNHARHHATAHDVAQWTKRHTELWEQLNTKIGDLEEFCEGWPEDWAEKPANFDDLDLRSFIHGPAIGKVA